MANRSVPVSIQGAVPNDRTTTWRSLTRPRCDPRSWPPSPARTVCAGHGLRRPLEAAGSRVSPPPGPAARSPRPPAGRTAAVRARGSRAGQPAGTKRRSADDLVVVQLGDGVRVVAEAGQHLVGVLTEQRRTGDLGREGGESRSGCPRSGRCPGPSLLDLDDGCRSCACRGLGRVSFMLSTGDAGDLEKVHRMSTASYLRLVGDDLHPSARRSREMCELPGPSAAVVLGVLGPARACRWPGKVRAQFCSWIAEVDVGVGLALPALATSGSSPAGRRRALPAARHRVAELAVRVETGHREVADPSPGAAGHGA